jgi:hypothetical protein
MHAIHDMQQRHLQQLLDDPATFWLPVCVREPSAYKAIENCVTSDRMPWPQDLQAAASGLPRGSQAGWKVPGAVTMLFVMVPVEHGWIELPCAGR